MITSRLSIKKFNIASNDLLDNTCAGDNPYNDVICECTDGLFIWDEDLIRYVPYTEESIKNYEWQHSKHIIPIPLRLNMTSDELMEICLEAGQRPIRHQVCQCTDGDFVWDELEYRYIPYIAIISS